jgi:hypothetical protein
VVWFIKKVLTGENWLRKREKQFRVRKKPDEAVISGEVQDLLWPFGEFWGLIHLKVGPTLRSGTWAFVLTQINNCSWGRN